MLRRRRRPELPPELAAARAAFVGTVARVEEAKEDLLLGVPRGRAAPLPFAEALSRFETGLQEAAVAMPAWRSTAVEPEWRACAEALRASAERAERLRLEATAEGYEELVPLIDAVLDPLGAFAAAAERFRQLAR